MLLDGRAVNACLVFAARAPWLVALLWAVSGIGMGPVTLSMTGYLIEKADPARLGLFTALLNWGITIGAVVASPLAGLLVDRSGWAALVPFTALAGVGSLIVGAPAKAVREDPEALLDRVNIAATSLLGLVGAPADPVKDREHILLSSLFSTAWADGHDLDLPALIQQIITPPFDKVGVVDLDGSPLSAAVIAAVEDAGFRAVELSSASSEKSRARFGSSVTAQRMMPTPLVFP